MKHVLPATGVGALYGPSGGGKSFVAIELTACLASGTPFFGHRTQARPVVYVGLEGEAGFRLRLEARQRHTGQPLPERVSFLLGQSFNLTERADVQRLALAIEATSPGGGTVVVIDTLNRAAPGADENSSVDMGRILEGTKELQRLTAGLVVLVHHTGKDATKGMRGHSSLHAGVDAAIEVTRDGDRREWRVAKAKDGEDGKAHAFTLYQVDLGRDADGDLITSCVVRTDNVPAATVALLSGRNQRLVLAAVRPLFTTGELGRTGAPDGARCVAFDSAEVAGAAVLTGEPRRRRQSSREALASLVDGGWLGMHEGFIWTL